MQLLSLYDTACDYWVYLRDLKASLDVPFPWYPYNTLANVEHIEKMLDGSGTSLHELLKGGSALDIGCADGEFAFFLESLGCQTDALDNPTTNMNRMAGIRKLREVLDSKVNILSVDIDGRFTLPGRRYEIAFFCGTLYHLRNPFYVLDEISRIARYCVLSTRIARSFHPRLGDVSDLPLAYLLDDRELNSDKTNYWVFSEAGLRRLLKRAHWDVLRTYTAKLGDGSDPWSLENDERIFCLVKSTYGAPEVQYIEGWYPPEDYGWRWTRRRFSASLTVPPCHGEPLVLTVPLFIHEKTIEQGPLTLSTTVDGIELADEILDRPGLQTYFRALPDSLAGRESLTVEFSLNRALPPDENDGRELGTVVGALSLERRA